MGKRKLPFGYKLKNGDVIIDDSDAECVKWIYIKYWHGASLKEITEKLNAQQRICYMPEKLWNKNIIARILQDQRYSGDALYPEIISEDLYESVQHRRAERQRPAQQSQAQKAIRILSGERPKEKVEITILLALNRLICNPEAVQSPEQKAPDHTQISRAQRKLDDIMREFPIDEECAAQLIAERAEAKYAMISGNEYETLRLQRIFQAAEPMNELSAELLLQTVMSISVEINAVKLTLKNNQTIEVSV